MTVPASLAPHQSKEWFQSWFDSPYYPILYSNRDESDAEQMIGGLVPHIERLLEGFPQPYKVLDVACGRGRYAKILHEEYGFDVEALDLSETSIKEASKLQKEGLRFRVGDMRTLDYRNEFHLVVNFFTSFGYFDHKEVNNQVLNRFHQALEPAGILILDYFNAEFIVETLIPEQTIEKQGIIFEIKRQIIQDHLVKSIFFNHQGKDFHFEEKVQLFYPSDFEEMLIGTGFEIQSFWGWKNRQLQPKLEQTSERLIIAAKKAFL